MTYFCELNGFKETPTVSIILPLDFSEIFNFFSIREFFFFVGNSRKTKKNLTLTQCLNC